MFKNMHFSHAAWAIWPKVIQFWTEISRLGASLLYRKSPLFWNGPISAPWVGPAHRNLSVPFKKGFRFWWFLCRIWFCCVLCITVPSPELLCVSGWGDFRYRRGCEQWRSRSAASEVGCDCVHTPEASQVGWFPACGKSFKLSLGWQEWPDNVPLPRPASVEDPCIKKRANANKTERKIQKRNRRMHKCVFSSCNLHRLATGWSTKSAHLWKKCL